MLETYQNIKGNKSNANKQNKINMASWHLNKTHKERKSNKLNMEKNTQTTWKIIKLKQSQTESNNI